MMGGNSQGWQRDMMVVVGLLEGSENGDSDKTGKQISTRIFWGLGNKCFLTLSALE